MKSLAHNLMNKISNKVKVFALAGIFVATITGAAYAGFSPADRPVFDWNNPSDRKGSIAGPVFNSFVNTPDYGDERAFFDASGTAEDGTYKDVLPYVTQDEDGIITLRTYVHNNANQTTNDGVGVAKNTKVRIDLPTGTDTMLRMRSYISASNASPVEVSDTTELVDTKSFSIEYVPGSAKIFNGNHKNGLALSDSIVTTGATIGSDQLNGDYLGCFEYASTVEIQVKINKADIDIEKKVKLATGNSYGETATAKPGDEVDWAIQVKNSGDATINNVVVRDVLPPHVELVPGSIRWIDTRQNTQQNDTALFDGGINFGSYAAGADMYVMLKTKALDDFEACEVTLRNLAFVKSDETKAEKQDHADLKIVKEDCEEPEEPIYSCDSLNIFKVDRDTFRFTINATAENGASIVSYAVNTGVETISSDDNTLEYTYAEAGEYDIKASVIVAVNEDQTKGGTVTSDDCEGELEVDEPEEPVYECIAVKASLISENTFRFNTITRVDGGASVKHYVYNFGDGSEATVSESVIEHEYTEAGEYNVEVTVVFNVNDELRSVECGVKVTIDEEVENCPVPGKGHLPADSDDCYENCPIEGFTHLPKDDARCKDKETPTVLPNTGAGSFIGLAFATTMFGAFAHRFALLRK